MRSLNAYGFLPQRGNTAREEFSDGWLFGNKNNTREARGENVDRPKRDIPCKVSATFYKERKTFYSLGSRVQLLIQVHQIIFPKRYES